jgi:predicted permease
MVRRRLPFGVRAIFRTLLPIAEQDEVLSELSAEYADRVIRDGNAAARRWALRQALGSVPALLRRGWWRGMTGFEPQANRLRPGGPMYESWIMDARYAVRHLLRRPVYAIVAVFTLALGTAGTAAVFSLAQRILLDPLPIAREEQVGVLWFGGSWNEQEILRLRPDFPGFQRMAAYRPADATLDVPGQPLRMISGAAVSSELLDLLGTPPLMGRTFKPGEDLVAAEPVAVLSHALWKELGSDANIVGKALQFGGVSRTVVGVMPAGFWFPTPETRVWTAAQMNPENRSGLYTLVGRVADDQRIGQMNGPLQAIASRLAANFQYRDPQWDKTRHPSIQSVREYFVGDVRPALIATLVAVALILLIASANVAALVLGQVDARANEIGMRATLGATRQRLIQQLVIESLLLGGLAGVTGAAIAAGGFTMLLQSLPLGVLADTAHLDWRVFWAAMIAATSASALVAVVPAVALWRGGSLQTVLATSRTGGVGSRSGSLESVLVVGQVALAVLLAAGAALLIRSVVNLRALEPGIRTDRAVVIDATLPARLTLDERKLAIDAAVRQLAALPGVQHVAATQKLPLRTSGYNFGIAIRGRGSLNQTTAIRMVTEDYFAAMGMTIRRGRNFSPSDRTSSERVVVINEALAAKFFPFEEPIGQVIVTFGDAGERIIGVVSNAAEARLIDGAVPARYVLSQQLPIVPEQVSLVVRTSDTNVVPLLQAARRTIEHERRDLAVQETTTLQAIFDRSVGPVGQVVMLVALLTLLALALGAVGVYGVISHFVQRRSREFGIRLALGQSPSLIVRRIVARGVLLVALGGVIGMTAALLLASLLASLLYGVGAADPLSMAGAVTVLLVVGVFATLIPARRASLLDPAVILRQS